MLNQHKVGACPDRRAKKSAGAAHSDCCDVLRGQAPGTHNLAPASADRRRKLRSYQRRTRIRRSVKERSKSLGIVAVAIAPTMGKWIGRAQIAALCKVEQLRTRTARSASIIVRMRSLGTTMPLKPTGYVVLSANGYIQFNHRTSFQVLLFFSSTTAQIPSVRRPEESHFDIVGSDA